MRTKQTSTSHAISSVFIFLLIGIFALTALTLTLIGTKVYRRVTETASANSDSQMVLSYLCNKVHNYDHPGGVTVEDRDGMTVLCLRETLDETVYETAIYSYDGSIWEHFAEAGYSFVPEEGQRLTDAAALRISQPSPTLLCAEVVMANGDTRTLHMALQTSASQAR